VHSDRDETAGFVSASRGIKRPGIRYHEQEAEGYGELPFEIDTQTYLLDGPAGGLISIVAARARVPIIGSR
jgi:hypothetical protein